MSMRFTHLAEQYGRALLDDVIPFWERHSIDHACGGYFTCLDRKGDVYDTDKFLWLQARQVWMFATLYRLVERRPAWLEMARHGLSFLARHGMNDEGDWYFSLTREGRPLVQPHSIFTDCFAAMGFGAYALAAGDDPAREIAVRTFRRILRRLDNPKGRYNKQVPGTRPLKSLALPMIMVNLSLELEGVIDAGELDETITASIDEIMTLFHDPAGNLLFDNVAPDGSHPDCFEGRVILPGHGIEVTWFVIEAARRCGDQALIDKATDIMLSLLEFGWDSEHGGILYYRDVQGHPPQQLEWDRKLWWVHIETLVALAKAYDLTRREACWRWYQTVHEYTWRRFPDPEYGEWFGYLDRRGERFLDLKGGKWKGCFHVPRGLYLCRQEFAGLAAGAGD